MAMSILRSRPASALGTRREASSLRSAVSEERSYAPELFARDLGSGPTTSATCSAARPHGTSALRSMPDHPAFGNCRKSLGRAIYRHRSYLSNRG